MAVFEIAYDWMMDNEDAGRKYAQVPDAPPGAFAISGINSVSFPSDFSAISALAQSSRGPSIQRFYQVRFWSIWFQQLLSDDLSKRVFDAAVNMGSSEAVKLLQAALGASVAQDGAWGPVTLQAANSANPDVIVEAFKQVRITHYKAIVESNPADAKYLSEWLARASK